MTTAAAQPPVVVEELTVRYGKKLALDRVSLAVPEGAVYALLGRNGAGKSSLVRCILGEQRPAAGRAHLLGRDIWRERASVLREVGVVPEDPNAPPAMSSRELARFCSRLYPRWDRAGLERRLERFGVPAGVPFGRLSKGQRCQVSLALALASSPRLLLLDDPTLGLDVVARKAVFEELIGELADRGITVFLTTHDLAAVEGIADRVAILQGGRLLLDEELERLKRRFRRISVPQTAPVGDQALLGFVPVVRVARGWGVESVVSEFDDERYESFRHSQGAAGLATEVSALTLEEIFVALVGTHPGETS
ncbi:MAG: ABC transporter ATP-binding protein [Acidobacteriota bacterium]|nr:ABC transporter ATP-binding protein [Acidobacteriota bacterium]